MPVPPLLGQASPGLPLSLADLKSGSNAGSVRPKQLFSPPPSCSGSTQDVQNSFRADDESRNPANPLGMSSGLPAPRQSAFAGSEMSLQPGLSDRSQQYMAAPPSPSRTPVRRARHSPDATELECTKLLLRLVHAPTVLGEHISWSSALHDQRLIGSGNFSRVFAVWSPADGQWLAVKRLRKQVASIRDRAEQVREVVVARRLVGEPHIVPYYGAWQENGRINIVMSLAERGSLAGLLAQARSCAESGQVPAALRTPELIRPLQLGVLPERSLWVFLAHAAHGLAAMHRRGLLYLDLKPDNTYITANGEYQLGDLGITAEFDTSAVSGSDLSVLSEDRTAVVHVQDISSSTVSDAAASMTPHRLFADAGTNCAAQDGAALLSDDGPPRHMRVVQTTVRKSSPLQAPTRAASTAVPRRRRLQQSGADVPVVARLAFCSASEEEMGASSDSEGKMGSDSDVPDSPPRGASLRARRLSSLSYHSGSHESVTGHVGLTATHEISGLSALSAAADDEGDVKYMAPDLLEMSGAGHRPPADMFSLGITLWEMATGRPATASSTAMLSSRISPALPALPAMLAPWRSEELLGMIQSLLELDASKRPSAQQVLLHPRVQAVLQARDPVAQTLAPLVYSGAPDGACAPLLAPGHSIGRSSSMKGDMHQHSAAQRACQDTGGITSGDLRNDLSDDCGSPARVLDNASDLSRTTTPPVSEHRALGSSARPGARSSFMSPPPIIGRAGGRRTLLAEFGDDPIAGSTSFTPGSALGESGELMAELGGSHSVHFSSGHAMPFASPIAQATPGAGGMSAMAPRNRAHLSASESRLSRSPPDSAMVGQRRPRAVNTTPPRTVERSTGSLSPALPVSAMKRLALSSLGEDGEDTPTAVPSATPLGLRTSRALWAGPAPASSPMDAIDENAAVEHSIGWQRPGIAVPAVGETSPNLLTCATPTNQPIIPEWM